MGQLPAEVSLQRKALWERERFWMSVLILDSRCVEDGHHAAFLMMEGHSGLRSLTASGVVQAGQCFFLSDQGSNILSW